jgi:Uma2 family endonuclease
MAASALSPATTRTVADLLKQLGGVSAERVRLRATLGPATEADLLAVLEQEGIACELVDGALVEKPTGALEAYLALRLGTAINNFLDRHDLGFATGADGPLRLRPGLVRLPDVSFVSWGQLPTREVPSTPVPSLYPDLAVEVLSGSNTPAEMQRKRGEYFRAGAQLVWEVRVLADLTPSGDGVGESRQGALLRLQGRLVFGFAGDEAECLERVDHEPPHGRGGPGLYLLPRQVDQCVPGRCQHLRRLAAARPAGALPERHVPRPVQVALDPQWPRLSPSRRAAPASPGLWLVVPWDTSSPARPSANRRTRCAANTWQAPGQSARYFSGTGAAVSVRRIGTLPPL